ncbi:MAG: redoxin domain-containing protein, partial [Actinobacteria bacterium]|nr:redoxin domain-containing protein [Actinomycetota bacterium]
QDKIVDSFKNSPDAQPLRDFITRTYGADYLTRLLDGPGVQPTQDNKPRPPVEVRPKPPVDNRPQPPVDNRPQPPVDNRPQPPQDNRPQPPVEVRPQPVQPPSPGSDPYADRSRYATFIDYPRQGDGTLFGDKGAKVADVAAHIKPELMPWVRSQILSQGFDTVTKVHETIHGIDADISTKRNGRAVEGFYLGDGKAAQVENPAIRKSDVGRFVPESLRESRYKTYLSGQPQYEDRPFKVMQEWNSYIHESEAAVDMVKAGKYRDGGMDAVKGSLEFTAYSFSAAMAAERLDPEGFKNNQNLKDFMAFQGVRAMDAYRAGKDMPEFKGYGMDRFVDSFKNSPDAQPLRDFITRTYGNEYLTRLLDGPGVQPPQDVKPQPVAPPQPVTPRPEPVTVGARPGQKPPEVNAEGWLNADGTPSLANRQGQVTVVEFWGTFCPPCRTSIPHLNEIQEKYKDKGLQVLALTGEDRATVERFAQGTRMNYAVGYGSNTSEAYGVSGVPHAVVVGRDGKVAYAGHPGDEAFDAAIKGAVEAPAPVPEVKPQPQPQPQPEPPRPAEDRFKDYKIGYQSDKVRTAHGSFLETMQGRLDETRLKRFDRMMVEFERRMGDRAYQRLLAGQDSGQVHREIESTIADTYQHLGEMVSAPDASRNVFDQKSRTFLAENFMLHAADPATYDQGGEGSCWLQAGTIATGWINHADGLARFMKEVTLTGDYTSLNQGRGNSSPRTYTFNRGIFALRGSTAAWTLDNALGGSARSPVGKILDEGLSAMLGRRSPYAGTYGEVAQVMYMVTGDTPASGTNGNQQRTLLEKGAYINYWPGHMLSQQLRREGDRWLIVQDNQWGERSDYVIARINDLRSWDARSEGRRGFEHFNPGGGGDNPLGPYLPNPNVGPPIPGGYNPQPAPGPGPGNPPGPGPRPWSPPGPGPGPGPGFVPGIGGGIGGGSGISGGIGSGYDLLHLLYMLMGLMEQGSIDPNMMAMISRLLSGPNGPALLQMLSAGQAAPQFLPPVAAMPGAANVPPAM